MLDSQKLDNKFHFEAGILCYMSVKNISSNYGWQNCQEYY